MGHKAEVVTIDQTVDQREIPQDLLFLEGRKITVTNSSSDIFKTFTDHTEITIADIDDDGYSDIFLPGLVGQKQKNLLSLDQKDPSHYSVDDDHPLAMIEHVNTVLWGDINDDGIIDAYLCKKGNNQLWQQDRAGNWIDITEKSGTSGNHLNTIEGALFDADHDGDLDIFTINGNGANELFNNNRDGSFRTLAKKRELTGPADSTAMLIQDLDKDRDADIIVINRSTPHQVHINQRLWQYSEGKGFEEFIHSDIVSLTAGDLNSDGRLELYSLSSHGSLTRWNRNEADVWQPTTLLQGVTHGLSPDNTRLG